MNKVSNFIKEFVALATGDTAEANALKSKRQIESALKSQIASLTGDTISLEDHVEEAKEKERLTFLNNGKLLSDRSVYVGNLVAAHNKIKEAEEDLENHLELIKFLSEKLEQINS